MKRPDARVILHVEDDRSLQSLVRAALERLGGYVVRSASDAAEALALARTQVPDLILLDLDLPGVDGVGTLHKLREVEGLGQVPAMFLTAAADPAARARLRALAACDVLGKPFRPRQLLQKVDEVLGRGSEQR
jgi:CheY-like chemotaxis protein